jgi:hypothetical protein
MLLAGSMFPAINTRKYVPMPARQGQSIHRNNNPLYNRVAGGISDVVGLGGGQERRLERELALRPIRELILTLVRRLARRLNLTRSVVRGLVARGLERRFVN